MGRIVQVTSPENERVKAVVRLRKGHHRRRVGRFVAEGRREIARALAAGIEPLTLFYAPELLGAAPEAMPPVAWPEGAGPRCRVTAPVFRKMAYRQRPEGVLAVFKTPAATLETLGGDGAVLWVVMVGLSKPGNLGAIARSAAAAGAGGLIVADGVVDPYHPNAIRASTGAVFDLPVAGAYSGEVRAFLAAHSVRPVLMRPEAERAHFEADLTGSVALVVGAEDRGLGAAWNAGAPEAIRVPMAGEGSVDSLNASVTVAVVLFEARRQRMAAGA